MPRFYERDEAGVPHGWVQVMKNAIGSNGPAYSMQRMVKDYEELYYAPAAATGAQAAARDYALARELAAWKAGLRLRWHNVHVEAGAGGPDALTVSEAFPVQARAWLHGIPEAQVAVEAVYGPVGEDGQIGPVQVAPLAPAGQDDNGATLYAGTLAPADSGRYVVGIRIRPQHPGMVNAGDTALVKWA